MNNTKALILIAIMVLAFAGIGAGKEGRDDVRLQVQSGHSNSVSCLAWNPDGSLLATGSKDNSIRLWNSNGTLLRILTGHKAGIGFLAWSPDGSVLASAAGNNVNPNPVDGNIILWSKDGTHLKILQGKEPISSLAWRPDASVIAAGSQNNTVLFWNRDGSFKKILEKKGSNWVWVKNLAWSPDGKILAIGSDDLSLWKDDGSQIKVIKGHGYALNNLAWSPDGKILVSGNSDYTTSFFSCDGVVLKTIQNETKNCTWNPKGNILALSSYHDIQLYSADGCLLKTLAGHSGHVHSLCWSPDGKTLASGSDDKTIHLWNSDGKLINIFEGYDKIASLAWNRDGKILASGSDKGDVYFWSKDGRLKHSIAGQKSGGLVSWSPDGRYIASSSDYDKINIWGIDGSLKHILYGEKYSVGTMAWRPDGQVLATSGARTIQLWKNDSSILKTIEGNCEYGLAWSPDGTILASYSFNERKIKFWTNTGTLISTIAGFENSYGSLSWSPDGKILASSDGNLIQFWNKDWSLLKSIKEENAKRAGFIFWSPDGEFLATIHDHIIRLWGKDGTYIMSINVHWAWVNSIAWGPDGKLFASGSDDTTICIWNTNGTLIKKINEDGRAVTSLSWKPDGKMLASGSTDSNIIIWDPSTGNCIATMVYLKNTNYHTYTPDNYYRLSGDAVNAVAFVKDKEMKAYGFDQFDLRHNRPDIVLSRLFPDKDRPVNVQEQIDRYKKYWSYRVWMNGFTEEQVSGKTKIHAPEVYDVKLNGLPLNVSMQEKKKGVKEADTQVKESSVKLSFKIKDEKGSDLNVIGYKIFVNGVPLHGQYIKRFDKPRKMQEVSESIALSSTADVGQNPGDNKIEISGFTEDGVESSRETVYLNFTGAEKNTKGNCYIVAIGVNDYSKAKNLEKLDYAVGDAKDIVKAFSEAGKSRYAKIIPLLITDGELTRNRIKELRTQLDATTVNDTVIFFMAGHGVRADTTLQDAKALQKEFAIDHAIGDISSAKDKVNIYYYMTGDSDADAPWVKGIPMDAIRNALDGIPARQKILMLDTCQSGEKLELSGYTPSKERLEEIRKKRGAMAKESQTRGVKLVHRGIKVDPVKKEKIEALNADVKEMSDMFPELRRGTGTIEISAATGVQSALEDESWNNGAFTYVVKEALLKGKAKNKEGKITAKSLRSYVLGEVEKLTGGEQTPMVCRDIAGRDFVVGE